MLITLAPGVDPARVRHALVALGIWTRTLVAADGRARLLVEPHSAAVDAADVAALDGVESVAVEPSTHPRIDAQAACVDIAGVALGAGAPPVLLAGPCSVESEERMHRLAGRVAAAGGRFLRGGAYKPRTSPYSFQGHGEAALLWLRNAADAHGLRVVTEATAEHEAALVAAHADLVQIGSRNMHNYALLRAVGVTGKPALLKRGMAATIEEWLSAGEYLLVHGAKAVVFCERGLRGFDATTRNVLDVGAIALLAHVHRQPVVADPSHAAGRRDLILPLARAALAAGASGLIVETHDEPGCALSDGPQALPPAELAALLRTAELPRAVPAPEGANEHRARA
ncbi:MAG: 3-deoxy-7-phosphoheptulonate synthase [Myxococcales bacterium]|nr:3-deoxy-7-phosphoheptulonate synthase [Myxococcales bacterium]